MEETSHQSDSDTSFESSFTEGLPSDYVPSDIGHYSSLQKLKSDYDYRWNKLQHQFSAEEKALRKSPGFSEQKMQDLRESHKKASQEFQDKHLKLTDEYLEMQKEQKASEEKGLR